MVWTVSKPREAIVKIGNYLSILLSKEDADVTSCDLGV